MKTHTDKTKRTRTRTPNNPTTAAYRISDELWALLEPLLPVHVNTHRFGGGRPRVPDRLCADAMFYVLRTAANGKPWTKPICVPTPLPTIAIKSGSKPTCF